jgi:uncharacterized protein (DUF302 family)
MKMAVSGCGVSVVDEESMFSAKFRNSNGVFLHRNIAARHTPRACSRERPGQSKDQARRLLACSGRVRQRLALIVMLASSMVFTASLGHAANDAPADQMQGSNVMTPDGLITSGSEFDPHETMDRVAAAVAKRGITILARIDHAAAAAKVGLKLRPTEVLIFGNPVTGTPLMQAAQTIGIDLPLKMLVWQDEAGKTWLAYNDPRWLAKRHGIESVVAQNLDGMAAALAAIAKEATSAAKAPT